MRKPFEEVDPRDFQRLAYPDGGPKALDGGELYECIFDNPHAPDIPFARWYLHRIPFFANGDSHKNLRMRLQPLLAERYAALTDRDMLSGEEKAVLFDTPSFNLVDTICKTLFNRMAKHYIVLPDAALAYLDGFNTFELHSEMRIGRIRDFSEIIKLIHDATLADPERSRYVDLIPTFLITRHTFIGTIAATIADMMERCASGLLADLEFRPMLTQTSLPIALRVATEDFDGVKRSYQKGRPYRCPVSTDMSERSEHNFSSFGDAPRVCLGRTMSFLVWRHLAQTLNEAIAARLVRGETRFEMMTKVDLHMVGCSPIGGDVAFY